MSAPLMVRVGDWLSTAELSLSHANAPTVGWSRESFNLHLQVSDAACWRRSSSSLLGSSIRVFSFSTAAAHWLYTPLPSCRRVIAGVWPQTNTTPSVYASGLLFCSAPLWSLASMQVFLFNISHTFTLSIKGPPWLSGTFLTESEYYPHTRIFIFKFCSVVF